MEKTALFLTPLKRYFSKNSITKEKFVKNSNSHRAKKQGNLHDHPVDKKENVYIVCSQTAT